MHTVSDELPVWAVQNKGRLHSLQVIPMLLQLSTKQPEIARLHISYAGGAKMTKDRWLNFVRNEQVQN